MDELTSTTLLRRVATGDCAAFEQLYQRHAATVYTYLLRLLNDEQAAQDVLQTSFLAVWQQAGRFRGQASVQTWLFRIAYYQAIAWLRHNRREQLVLSLEETQEDKQFSETISFEQFENRQELTQALKLLNAEQRAILELTFVHNLSADEIAWVLNCPPATIKSRLYRTLRLLAGLLQRLKK